MSAGWDIVQAVAATAELIKLAQETIKFLIRVTRAQEDAAQLLDNTKNLKGLVESVDRVLKHRAELRGSYVLSPPEQSVIQQLEDSLSRCTACLNGIWESFGPLVKKGRLFDRVKFVVNKNQIAKREVEVLNQIQLLSPMLSLLSIVERGEHDAAERQHRHRQDQHQRNMEVVMVLLLRHITLMFQRTDGYAPYTSPERPVSNASSDMEVVVPRPLLTAGDSQAQTLGDILGRPSTRSDFDGGLQSFQFPSNPASHEDEAEMAVSDRHSDCTLSYMSSNDDVYSDSDLASRLDINQFADDTTLITAVEENEVELVRNLICDEDAKVNVTVKDEHGWTLLHHAASRHLEEIVEILLTQNACRTKEYLNAKNNVGETALIIAARAKSRKAGFRNIERLLDQPECQIDATDGLDNQPGFTALYYAVHDGDPTFGTRKETVHLLARRGANVQAVHKLIPGQVRNFPFLAAYLSNSAAYEDDDDRRRHRRRASEATKDHGKNNFSELLSRRNSAATATSTAPTMASRRWSLFRRRTSSTMDPPG